jgi:hypothetical protein
MCRFFRRSAAAGFGIPFSREIEKVFQDQVAVLRCDAFGMKLHPVNGQARVLGAHDKAVSGACCNRECLRHGRGFNDKRMVSRRLERPVDAAEDATSFVLDV